MLNSLQNSHLEVCCVRLFQAISLSLADQLPPEPADDDPAGVSTIRLRAPDNRVLLRRFRASTSLETLLNYVGSEGFHTEDFKVLTTFPRRDVRKAKSSLDKQSITSASCCVAMLQLCQEDRAKNLKELRLFPQETLTLEER